VRVYVAGEIEGGVEEVMRGSGRMRRLREVLGERLDVSLG
jgi:hypothetical protein